MVNGCQLRIDFFCNYFPCHQAFNLPFCRSICRFLDKTLYCIIAACVHPVILRLYMRFTSDPVTIIQHIPRTVHIPASELITVIPLFDNIIMIRCIIISEKLSDFLIRKPKIFVKTFIRKRQYFQIIKPGKNTLF